MFASQTPFEFNNIFVLPQSGRMEIYMDLNSKNLNKKGALSSILLVAISALCALGMPFSDNMIVAGVLAAVCSAFLIVTAERKPATVLLLLSVMCLFFNSEGISLIDVLLGLIVGCGTFSRALEKHRSPFLWAIPVASFVIGALFTKNVVLSMLSLGFVLPAAALSFSFSKKYSRVGAICLISGAFMVSFVIFLLADVYAVTGTISLSFFEEGAEFYRSSFAAMLKEFAVIDPSTEELKTLFTELEAQNLANEIVSLFPAFFVIGCNAMAYFSQKLMYVLVRREGEEHKFEDKMIALIMSPYAGATFLISFIVMIAASTSVDHALAYTVSENIFYIFIPGLAASGIMFQVAKIARFRRGAWVAVLFVILAFVSFGSALLLAAGIGAYYSIANPVFAFINSHKDEDPFK